MSDTIIINGLEAVKSKLTQAEVKAPDELKKAMYQVALGVTRDSQRRTPVDTGALRASHETLPPTVSGRDFVVPIVVGGPAAGYAVQVHENLGAIHPKGGEAKFLENAVRAASATYADDVAKRFDLNRLVG